MTEDKFLSAKQVSALLNCSYDSALRVMRTAGCHKIGALVRIKQSALDAYIEQGAQPTPKQRVITLTKKKSSNLEETLDRLKSMRNGKSEYRLWSEARQKQKFDKQMAEFSAWKPGAK